MKDFDTKWQAVAAKARQVNWREEQLPFGFATRVTALVGQRVVAPLEVSWDRVLTRLLAVAIVVLIACGVMEFPHLRDTQPLKPGIENTVAQLVWSL